MKPVRFLLIAIVFSLLAGCSSNHITDNFEYLGGAKNWKVQAAPGQTLHIEYKAVLTQGSLELQVISPSNKVLWSVKGDSHGAQTKDLPITVSGTYTLQIRATAAYGSYDLQYAVKKSPTP